MAKNYWIKAAENRTKLQLDEISPMNLNVSSTAAETVITTMAILGNQLTSSANNTILAETKPRIKVNSGDAIEYEARSEYFEGYRAAREYIDSYKALSENLKSYNSNKDNLKVI